MLLKGIFRSVGGAAFLSVALFASGFLVIFTPLPLLYIFAVRGRRSALFAALLSLTAVAAAYIFFLPAGGGGLNKGAGFLPIPWAGLMGFMPADFIRVLGVGYFLFFAVLAVVLGEGAVRKWRLEVWGGAALLSGLLVMAGIAVFAHLMGASAMFSGWEGYLNFIIDEVVKASASSGSRNAPFLFIEEHTPQVIAFVTRVLPALAFVFALLAVALNLVAGRRLIKEGRIFSHVHNVARFRLPDALIWGLIVSSAAFFAAGYFPDAVPIRPAAFNGLIAFSALYFLQGFAVAAYFLQGIRAPLLRAAAYIAIIFFFQTVSLVFVAVGVADVWGNFRFRFSRARHNA